MDTSLTRVVVKVNHENIHKVLSVLSVMVV